MELGKIEVSGVNAKIVCRKRIPRGIVGGTVEIRYTDPIWDSLTKTVVFRGSCVKDVMSPGAVVQIPAEVVADAGALLQVGVYGVDAENNLVIPTLWADLGYIESSADPSGDEAADPQLPVWAQLQEQIGDLSKLETEDKSSLVAAVNEARKTDKTFGDETVYYEWNEETEYTEFLPAPSGVDLIVNQFVKVSDDAPDADFFVGKYFRAAHGDEEQMSRITEDYIYPVSDLVYNVLDMIYVVSDEETVEEIGITFTKGIWAADGFKEDASLHVDTWQILDPATFIDEKYIPDTIARTADVIVAPTAASVGQVLAVKTVDEKGRPTEWEAVDMAKDGSEGTGSSTNGDLTEPAEDDIPKVFISGVKPTTKDDVLAEMHYISKTENFHAYLEIKCQGTSSMAYDKKNFTVKMYSDEARETKLKKVFKDWGFAANKYVLKANYIDHSHARNIVSARLWNEAVSSRPDYGTLPEEMRISPRNGAVDGFPVKIYYNGTYEGIYTWNIGKDDWMWNMDEDNPNHVLLCAETNTGTTYAETACNFRSLWSGYDENHWSVEVGTNSEALKTSLNNLIQFVMDNDGDDFKNGIGRYLNIQSAIDYYIHQYIICNIDGLAKNLLLATYDGVKWICGAYDMDSTYGLYWNGSKFLPATTRCPEDYEEKYSLLWERIESLYIPEIKERYSSLRKTVYSYANMITHFERITDLIGTELYEEDVTIYTSIPSADGNNIRQLREFIRDRLQYVDGQIEALTERIPCTSIQLDKTDVEFTAEGTQTITATVSPENTTDAIVWNSSDGKVASVENGMVTAVGNGACTIIARCGEYSASCNVFVSGLDEDTSLLYKLDGTKVMNGTSDYIDTGVKPYVEDTDLTILIDFENAETQAGSGTSRHILSSGVDQKGMIINAQILDGSGDWANAPLKFRWTGGAAEDFVKDASGNILHLESTGRIRVAFRKDVTAQQIKYRACVDGNANSGGSSAYSFVSSEGSVMLGAFNWYEDKIGDFWTGTLYNAEIYNRVLTDEEVDAFLTGQS